MEAKGWERLTYIWITLLTIGLTIRQLGSWRLALSSCVTYSHQMVLLSFAWWMLSVLLPHVIWLHRIQPVMVMYNMVSLIVHITMIQTTRPSAQDMDRIQLMCDVMVHVWIPLAYFLDWYTSRQPNGQLTSNETFHPLTTPFNWAMGYPCLYAIFIHVMSKRRGYAIYPFLEHVGGQVAIFFIFVVVYLGIWWLSSHRLAAVKR